MPHGIPQSLMVFAVSGTLETSNFGMFDGVAHLRPPPPLDNFYLLHLSILIVYMHTIFKNSNY